MKKPFFIGSLYFLGIVDEILYIWKRGDSMFNQSMNIKGNSLSHQTGFSTLTLTTNKLALETMKKRLDPNDTEASKQLNEKIQVLEKLIAQQEEEENEALAKITKKVENCEKLTPQELMLLKEKNPKLYQEVMLEETVQKNFEERLKNCKSREEAQDTYISELNSSRKIFKNGTPEGEERYKRIIKRLNKSWEKYLQGKLDEKDKPTSQGKSVEDLKVTIQDEATFLITPQFDKSI